MNGGGSCQHHPDMNFGETKRLDLRRNQAFHNASGGDGRDRTVDLSGLRPAVQPSAALIELQEVNGSGYSKTKAAILSDDCFLSMVETDGIEPLTS